MSKNVFKYPGGKTQMADWISSHFPQHECFVEVFGGSAAVTANKGRSKVEVYNDLDGDLVHFFVTMRDNTQELIEWLRDTPHSRELHDRYSREFYNGVRPTDDIERAGRFFYLRETQFAAKYSGPSGYNGSAGTNPASNYANKRERLTQWSKRFDNVQIEQLDYADLFDRYDSGETLFYLDPPYVKEGDELYSHSEFDHERFVDELSDLLGSWCVSYTDLPPGLEDIAETVATKEQRYRMAQGQHDWEKTNTERLVMNYDPKQESMFSSNNTELEAYL